MTDLSRRQLLRTAGSVAVSMPALPALGAPVSDYRQAVRSEEGLIAYWPLDGDLRDAVGGLDGRPGGGSRMGYAESPAGDRGVNLSDDAFVHIPKADPLDMDRTTVELLFKLTDRPAEGSEPCLIAKRGERRNRFSVHVGEDLSKLVLWDNLRDTFVYPPAGPLEVGRWHHLAISCHSYDLRLYLDGVHCPGGDRFTFKADGLPLQIGAATPGGDQPCPCLIDEVAVYDRILPAERVAAHVDALGWAERRKRLARTQQELHAKSRRRDRRELRRRINDPELTERGEQQVYRGEHLEAVHLPVGGNGAGCVLLNGYGRRDAWQIFNNFRYAQVPHSFFAVRAETESGEPVVRAVQAEDEGPLPGMGDVTFRGEYPFGWWDFEDAALPVRISMEAYNPLIPLNEKDSAIPCGIFALTARNDGDEPAEVAFLATQQNAVGFTGNGEIDGRTFGGYGGNRNELIRENGGTILHMSQRRKKPGRYHGDLALLADTDELTATPSWDDAGELIDAFRRTGKADGPAEAGPTPNQRTADGALAAPFTLRPGEARTVRFVLVWHMPNALHGGELEAGWWPEGWKYRGQMYANWWPDALATARYVHQHLDRLERETRLYHETLYRTNLPRWLLDRISSQQAVLRTRTCFWSEGGYFGVFEGTNRTNGCCPGNCTHVWHYAQGYARLLPGIGRIMREGTLRYQSDEGALPFRHPSHPPATDGQCGEILGAYREHLMCPDGAWLAEHWPRIRKAIEYVIERWDGDEDGVLAGPQHNTLDGELTGNSSWIGTLYLAALGAGAEMADRQNEPRRAERYRRIRRSGAEKQNAALFNGSYYIQIPGPDPHQEYADGCHIDQALGEWWARQVGLDGQYPPNRVRSAMRALLDHNFRADFRRFAQWPRRLIGSQDAGLLMITWPNSTRPEGGIRHGGQVMSGFEYSAAATMMQLGMIREGLAVAKAAAERYDGRLRTGLTAGPYSPWGYSGNPFGDDECGKFYGRAMSAWSMLLALQGFDYDGPAQRLAFRPRWQPDDHRSMFTAAEGWGLFHQRREGNAQTGRVEIVHGSLRLRELTVTTAKGEPPAHLTARLGDETVECDTENEGTEARLRFGQTITVTPDRPLEVKLSWAASVGDRQKEHG